MLELKTLGFFVLTARAEITGCFLPYLWLRKDGSPWLLLPAALSLAVFAWLLNLHPAARRRRACLCRVWGRLYRRGIAVAVESRPRAAQFVGHHRRRRLGRRDGHHRVWRLASIRGDLYVIPAT